MATFDTLLNMIINTFVGIFNFLLQPVTDFLTQYSSSFSNFLLNLFDWTGFTDFMSSVSFGGLILGATLPIIITILIIYFFIP